VILQLNFFPSEFFIVPGDELEEGILVYGRFSITNTFFRKIPLTPPRRCLSPFFLILLVDDFSFLKLWGIVSAFFTGFFLLVSLLLD